jgi:hypothetical protein
VRRVFGPRTAIEAAFLVAVPVVSLMAGLGPYAIVAASAIGYLVVLLVEALLWRRGAPLEAAGGAAAPVEAVPVPEREREQEPEPVPEPEPEPEPDPEPVSTEPEPVATEPELPVTAEQEPVPVPERVLQPVPDLEPEPEPEPAAAAEPVVVVPIGVGGIGVGAPRSWNLWDLERLSRESAGHDAVRDEERTFLLMYLREFAGPDGVLPDDFDSLVRDSFGDLVGTR